MKSSNHQAIAVSPGLASPGNAARAAGAESASFGGSPFAAHRGPQTVAFVLLMLENALRVAQPLAIGAAVNGLVSGSYAGVFWLVLQHLSHLLVGSFRQRCDARAFTALDAELSTREAIAAREPVVACRRPGIEGAGSPAGPGPSRADVEFLTGRLPRAAESAWSIGGAAMLLAWHDWALLPYCALLLVPAALINASSGRRMQELSGLLDDQLEREARIVRGGSEGAVRRHFDAVARWRVRLSDADAVRASLLALFVLATLVSVLVRYCTRGETHPGDIVAVVGYVLMLAAGLDAIPRLGRTGTPARPFPKESM